ncbi:MAG: DUF485 domain-containing protein [Dehalococcoidales bacterium]|nr:DUF485 domain-containing protein [Dehalococcoidales bacterium]
MEHGQPAKLKTEKSEGYKTRLGIIMFTIFTPIYLAFILVSVMSPSFMAADLGKLNVAIVYGFGIIILAVALAVIYNSICSRKERDDEVEEAHKEGSI